MISPEDVHAVVGKRMVNDVFDFVLDIEKSQGMYLHDSKTGKKYLDFFGFFASSAIGMNHPKMFEPNFLKKLTKSAINKPTNSDVLTVEMAEFVDTLSRIATPSYMKYFFFIEGGALAVENALKTAFDWKIKKNFNKGIQDVRGQKVIHLTDAFHGRSGYTLAITNTSSIKKVQYFPRFNWPRVTNPKITFPLNDDNLKKVQELEKKSLDEVQKAISEEGDHIAAFIMEPIQGEGGDNHFRKEYLQAIRKITAQNDILFVVDEIQSGVGITGKWWAHQHFDVKPDILAFGKKMQVCGIMAGPKLEDINDHVFRVPNRIDSTWGGNLADMVRATRYLEIINEEKLIDNAAKMGKIFLKGLTELQDKFPGLISNARGRGLMCAFDLPSPALREEFYNRAYANKLIVLRTGASGIRFRPALIVEENHVNEALSILEKVASEIELKEHNNTRPTVPTFVSAPTKIALPLRIEYKKKLEEAKAPIIGPTIKTTKENKEPSVTKLSANIEESKNTPSISSNISDDVKNQNVSIPSDNLYPLALS